MSPEERPQLFTFPEMLSVKPPGMLMQPPVIVGSNNGQPPLIVKKRASIVLNKRLGMPSKASRPGSIERTALRPHTLVSFVPSTYCLVAGSQPLAAEVANDCNNGAHAQPYLGKV